MLKTLLLIAVSSMVRAYQAEEEIDDINPPKVKVKEIQKPDAQGGHETYDFI